jgi:glycosyltransferase involved in cell wall biosynthesis
MPSRKLSGCRPQNRLTDKLGARLPQLPLPYGCGGRASRGIAIGTRNMENFPKISIITPTLNAATTLEACIKSVAHQTYAPKEHLIIDGQSTDGTLGICRKYAAKFPQIKWVSEKDGGIYDAMNKGIDLSSGEWLYFLGSDDLFCSNTILHDIFSRTELPKYDVIYGNVKWGNTEQLYDGEFSRLKLLQHNICHQAIFTRKTVFDQLGKYDTNYTAWADWVFNLQWYNRKDIPHCYIDLAIARYNLEGYSKHHHDLLFLKNKGDLIAAYFPPEYHLLHQEISSLQAQLAERDQILASLWASPFWKITRPLRQAIEIVRKLRSYCQGKPR